MSQIPEEKRVASLKKSIQRLQDKSPHLSKSQRKRLDCLRTELEVEQQILNHILYRRSVKE